jgi:hypothetical protein
VTPPSGVTVPPQIPFAEPTGITQAIPAQQSAVVVHAPLVGMQVALHRLFTQGFPQQSALVAQAVPAGIGTFGLHAVALRRQRGIPRPSLRQQLSGLLLHQPAPGAPLGSQQLFSDEQDSVLGLQMLPGSRHAVPLSQRPNSWVSVDFEHWTAPLTGAGAPDHPQQSLSLRQISPVGEQPDGGWQMKKPPLAPVGAQTREQHAPPQEGAPAETVLQTVPLTEQFVVPGALTVAPQAPSGAPVAFWQLPPQQSKLSAHTSPVCAQNEIVFEQKPFEQRFEQHCVPSVHGLPDVLQLLLRGTQRLPVQVPPQHSGPVVHAVLSALHCVAAHWLPMHESVQHSLPRAHEAPEGLHRTPVSDAASVTLLFESGPASAIAPSPPAPSPPAPSPPAPSPIVPSPIVPSPIVPSPVVPSPVVPSIVPSGELPSSALPSGRFARSST